MAEIDVVACSGAGSDEAEVDIEFHGVFYTISIHNRSNEVLVVEIEDKDSFERWRGEFAAKYVEDITSKTGNFKTFAVFVRMLHSAVLQQSDAVNVDLLTYQDLELLKSRKAAVAAGGAAAAASQQQRQLPVNNKRYLILTYASEFDRVHYPLPLLHEGQPDPQRLRGVIQQLRQQLEDVLAGQQQQQQQQQQQRSRQHISSTGQRSSQAAGSAEQADAAVLSSRLEVMAAQLGRERAEHKRELRRSARQLQELQEELSRSRDVSRQLRLKLKACEQELSDAQEREQHLKAAAAAGPAPGSRRGSGRVGGPYQAASGWSKGSSYLGGGPGAAGSSRQYNKFPGKGSSRAAAGGSAAASSRGSSPASSRAQSPGYNRPWAQNATPPRPPRPSSAPPKQRFDPTEYVRQRQARQQQAASYRGSSSRGSSPARSTRGPSSTGGGSAASTPRASSSGRGFAASPGGPVRRSSGGDSIGSAGVSRQGSVERRAGAAAGSGYLRPTLSSGGASDSGMRGASVGSAAAAGDMRRSGSRDRLGAVYGAGAGAAGALANRGSRSSSRQGNGLRELASQPQRPSSCDGAGAASPGRALQGVKEKLSAFMAKQQHDQPPARQHSPRQQGVLTIAHAPAAASPAAAAAAVPAAAGQLASGGSGVFEAAGSEIASIDARLSALQDFLRKAKSSAAAS
uniref:Coiled-coil domain-containing protein 61 n=1 Tax=Tetradesmus obliquus TaxID=3088 RepID=A0A383WMQ5_TETOB